MMNAVLRGGDGFCSAVARERLLGFRLKNSEKVQGRVQAAGKCEYIVFSTVTTSKNTFETPHVLFWFTFCDEVPLLPPLVRPVT